MIKVERSIKNILNFLNQFKPTIIPGNSFFTSGENRPLINAGVADYTPIFLSDASRYFAYSPVQLDAVLTQVSPRDKYGFYTLGMQRFRTTFCELIATRKRTNLNGLNTLSQSGATLVCVTEAIQNSKLLICQVNKNIPRTFGDTTIHESQIDVIVEQDAPLVELPEKAFSEEDVAIGKLIAENFVEDGSTLQMGIGKQCAEWAFGQSLSVNGFQ